ncbi:hypothetical protein Tco_1065584, partial [Tanacetum coccineum]
EGSQDSDSAERPNILKHQHLQGLILQQGSDLRIQLWCQVSAMAANRSQQSPSIPFAAPFEEDERDTYSA